MYIKKQDFHPQPFQAGEPRRKVIFRLLSLFVVIVLLAGSSSSVFATTPAGSDGVPKPENLVIYTPWANGVNAVINGDSNGYGDGGHTGTEHFALDFNLNPEGSLVFPVRQGDIVYSGDGWSTYGNTVIIRHDIGGDYYYYSQYAHLANINPTIDNVGKDDTPRSISISTTLGNEGDTGGDWGVHLHFSLRRCDRNANIWVGDLPNNLFHTTICQSVVPEPMIGREVYEGFGLSTNWSGPLYGGQVGADTVPGPPS